MIPASSRVIDPSVEDSVRRFPTVDLVKMIFPDVRMRGRSVMCSPFREERHASFSCFRDGLGYSRWKDHTTGESGDNIDFYKKAFPDSSLDYPDTVDRLSVLLFGKHAFLDPSVSVAAVRSLKRVRREAAVQKEAEPALRVVSESCFSPSTTPREIVEYQRSREISDEVSSRYCLYVVFENLNHSGRSEVDRATGLPIVGKDGRPVPVDIRQDAVSIPNDIGGRILRCVDTPQRKGFKGATRSFVTTILADGTAPSSGVSFFGLDRSPEVKFVRWDRSSGRLYLNESAGVFGVELYAVPYCLLFLDSFVGMSLVGRERDCALAVLRSLNGPVNSVATVVEGMHDALSLIEIEKSNGHGTVPGTDLVVLNSVSNLKWAVPFLSMHREVRSLLDNDLKSSAGEKAFVQMQRLVGEFSAKAGSVCNVRSDSVYFQPYKDVNDYLVASRREQRERMRLAASQSRVENRQPLSERQERPAPKGRRP